MGRLRIADQGLIQELILGGGSQPLRLLSKATLTKNAAECSCGCCKPSSGVGANPPKNSVSLLYWSLMRYISPVVMSLFFRNAFLFL